MQIGKKYFTEGLIQLTILLSFIGVRVDVDSYLSGYYPPLTEINLGPSSAYTQTPFHILRDTHDGYGVHPKCPELDYFFASRRLLDEVRTLGSPRFHTQLNAWLVHQVSATDKAEHGPSTSSGTDTDGVLESPGDEAGDSNLSESGQEVRRRANLELGQGPCHSGASVTPQEEDEAKVKEEDPVSLTQLAHSSSLEQEDLDSLVSGRLPDLSTDITGAISQDVSLHDAMVTSAGIYGESSSGGTEPRTSAQQQRTLLRLDSTGSSDTSPEMALGLAALPFASVCNMTASGTAQGTLDDCLDEAVFDQINQLGLEGLETMNSQLLGSLGGIEPHALEDLDSDSGLSLESSSGGPLSPGSSEISSSSSSYCEDECGATGYSSEVESVLSKGIPDYSTTWPPSRPNENVWHDHSYASPALFNKAAITLPHKIEEPFSDDACSELEERELSRDELRAPRHVHSVFRPANRQYARGRVHGGPGRLRFLIGPGHPPEGHPQTREEQTGSSELPQAQTGRYHGLQEEVERLQAQRDRLLRDKQLTAKTMGAVGHQIRQLTRDVLARLRDRSGQPLNPERYTLQCGANGRVVVQRIRQPAVSTSAGSKTDKRKKDKKQ
ncbi:Nuclear factor erythroid 2-related factor 1 [Oryzias melastigma]|uniref:Nuclear factor erythroid 2-related factor 1 n=1 Tax=Oryzias melastigma TaxID=30732 RepID=A0A834FP55_ORYME|nr:Nuclear factor erythroid 2-related factor 1 [Oryzias melastigma]